MRLLTLLVLALSAPALADIVPVDVSACRGLAAGAACTTPEGGAGTCQEMSVSRPDYSGGIPPKYKTVKMLGCVAVAKGQTRHLGTAWLGGGLAFLALVAALATRRRAPAAATAG